MSYMACRMIVMNEEFGGCLTRGESEVKWNIPRTLAPCEHGRTSRSPQIRLSKRTRDKKHPSRPDNWSGFGGNRRRCSALTERYAKILHPKMVTPSYSHVTMLPIADLEKATNALYSVQPKATVQYVPAAPTRPPSNACLCLTRSLRQPATRRVQQEEAVHHLRARARTGSRHRAS